MEDKRNTESVVQEIMGLALNVACAGIDYGRATQTADGGALKRLHDAEEEVESKLRELVERCSVREPLSDEDVLSIQERYVGGVCPQYPLDASDWINFARAIERAHNIANTTKE